MLKEENPSRLQAIPWGSHGMATYDSRNAVALSWLSPP